MFECSRFSIFVYSRKINNVMLACRYVLWALCRIPRGIICFNLCLKLLFFYQPDKNVGRRWDMLFLYVIFVYIVSCIEAPYEFDREIIFDCHIVRQKTCCARVVRRFHLLCLLGGLLEVSIFPLDGQMIYQRKWYVCPCLYMFVYVM